MSEAYEDGSSYRGAEKCDAGENTKTDFDARPAESGCHVRVIINAQV